MEIIPCRNSAVKVKEHHLAGYFEAFDRGIDNYLNKD
jgi:hypothetical protein